MEFEFKFGRTARKHRIGRAHAMAAILSGATPTVEQKEHEGVEHTYLTWIANDESNSRSSPAWRWRTRTC